MERKRAASPASSQAEQSNVKNGQVEVMSIAQIQSLVHLLDKSDVSELELKRASEGIHLVLRKVKAGESSALVGEGVYASPGDSTPPAGESANANRHNVVAPLVGVFHPWLKSRGGTLVAVGDRVKVGQVIGTIESLNVFNEVETSVAGRVVEVCVQDGQPVEYGKALIAIDTAEVEEA